jgi:hypothetical protein
MAQARKRECPECQGPMYRIRLIDKAHGQSHAELEYTVPQAHRSFWLGQYPVEGRVAAYMCDHCGRVLLYGIPYDYAEETAEGA